MKSTKTNPASCRRILLQLAGSILLFVPTIGASAARGPLPSHVRQATGPNVFLVSSMSNVKTSTHRSLILQVFLSLYAGTPKSYLDLDLTEGTGKTGLGLPSESHTWSITLPAKSLKYSETKGTLSVSSGTGMGPLGMLNLQFTRATATPGDCISGSLDQQSGALSGKLDFNTQSSKWGVVGSKTSTFHFPKVNMVSYDSACVHPTKKVPESRCAAGYAWAGGAIKVMNHGALMGTETFNGGLMFNGPAPEAIQLTGTISLTAPSGATRTDFLFEAAPAATYTKHVMHFRAATKGVLFTGGAAVTRAGSPYTPPTSPCLTNSGGHRTQNLTEYYNSIWNNTVSHPLTVRMSLGPTYMATDASVGHIWMYSYS